MSDAAAVAVHFDPAKIGAAIDWVYAHREAIQWVGSIVLTYVWAWIAHKQPAKIHDAGGIGRFLFDKIMGAKR